MVAGVTINSTSAYNLLQEEFTNGVNTIIPTDTFFYNMLRTGTGFTFAGKHVTHSLNGQRNTSTGYMGQVPSAYPTPGTIKPQVISVPQCIQGGTIRVDKTAIMKTSKASFASAWTEAYESTLEHMMNEKERICLSNGSCVLNIHGAIGRVSGALAPTAAGWTHTISVFDAPKIRDGMQIEYWRVGTALNQANWRNATKLDTPSQGFYTISSVVPDFAAGTATVTIAEASPGTAPPVAGAVWAQNPVASNFDYMVVVNSMLENASASTTNLGREPMGLDGIACGDNGTGGTVANNAASETGNAWIQTDVASGIAADDTFEGLSAVTYGYHNAITLQAQTSATSWTATLTRQMMNKMSVLMGVFSVKGELRHQAGFVGNPAQINAYAQTLEPAERYTIQGDTPSSLPAGRDSLNSREGQGPFLMFAGKPFYGSTYARADRLYFYNPQGVEKCLLEPFQFDAVHDDYGGRPAKQMDGMGADNIASRNRRCLGAIHGLALPSLV